MVFEIGMFHSSMAILPLGILGILGDQLSLIDAHETTQLYPTITGWWL